MLTELKAHTVPSDLNWQFLVETSKQSDVDFWNYCQFYMDFIAEIIGLQCSNLI